MSPVPITPNLKLITEEQHWFWALTFLKQTIEQLIERVERVGKKPHLSCA